MCDRRPPPKFEKKIPKKDTFPQILIKYSPKSGYKRGGGT